MLRNHKEQEEPEREIKKEASVREEENQNSVVSWRPSDESVAWRKLLGGQAWWELSSDYWVQDRGGLWWPWWEQFQWLVGAEAWSVVV